MPRAPRQCPADGCTELIRSPKRYCPTHTREKSWSAPRTASSKATGTSQWQRLRRRILDRDGHLCQIRTPDVCTGRADVVDHIRPAARGGSSTDPSNLRAACRACNARKGRTTDKQ